MQNSFTIRNLFAGLVGLLVWGGQVSVICDPLFGIGGKMAGVAIAQDLPVITPTTPAAKQKVAQGLTLIQQGLLQQAIATFQEAIILDPNFWQAHYNLGLALRQTGDLQGAVQAFYTTVTLQPDFALGYASVGGVLVDAQNWSQAQLYLQRALSLDPNLAIAHYNLGLVHRQAGRREAAIQAWQTTRQLVPDFRDATLQLAEVYLDGDRPTDAQKLLDELLYHYPDFVAAHYLKGRIFEYQGNANAALDAFRLASQLDPTYANAYYAAAKILIANDRRTAALPLLDYAIFLYTQQQQTLWANTVQTLRQQIQ